MAGCEQRVEAVGRVVEDEASPGTQRPAHGLEEGFDGAEERQAAPGEGEVVGAADGGRAAGIPVEDLETGRYRFLQEGFAAVESRHAPAAADGSQECARGREDFARRREEETALARERDLGQQRTEQAFARGRHGFRSLVD